MDFRALPDPILLRKLLRYDPLSGELFWNQRDKSDWPNQDCPTLETKTRGWNKRHAGKKALNCLRNGYRCGTIFATVLQAHRVAWAIVTGEDPKHEIDHINGDRSDNRWSNLRSVSATENRRNSALPSHNSSGVMGVSYHFGKWRATITINRKQIHLGRFKTFEDAANARRAAERNYDFHPNHGRIKSC